MAEDSRKAIGESQPAEPPGGGRQDHHAMQAAAARRVEGPASTGTLAAGGGLEVPGREPHAAFGVAAESELTMSPSLRPHEPIPGERDASTLTGREPGAMGGQFTGGDIPEAATEWLDERTAFEHALEGGGDTANQSRPPRRREVREISGPGAADFVTAPGGVDRPESDLSKGMGQTRDEGLTSDPDRLAPQLDAPAPEEKAEKQWESPMPDGARPRERRRS